MQKKTIIMARVALKIVPASQISTLANIKNDSVGLLTMKITAKRAIALIRQMYSPIIFFGT